MLGMFGNTVFWLTPSLNKGLCYGMRSAANGTCAKPLSETSFANPPDPLQPFGDGHFLGGDGGSRGLGASQN
eukprot:6479232-Amphidinium_carterae.1